MTRYTCLVHYHELGLKGRNRSTFEQQLRRNVAAAVAPLVPQAEVARISGRLLVSVGSFDESVEVARVVTLVPGVARVSCALRTNRDLDEIQAAALEVLGMYGHYESFKVVARRANTDFYLDSMEMNRRIGAFLCEQLPDKRVRMTDVDAKVHVEVIEGSAFVYVRTERGVGGLPVGSSGKVVCLLSAGIDSPVAAWRMMRRGAQVIGLHFSGAPESPDTSSYLVREIARVLRPAAGLRKLCCVAFGTYQRELTLMVPDKLRVVFYRRLMFAVANAVAVKEGAKALVTGESLGQVASQTLDNIRAVDAVAEFPVLRPLIGTDKQEIIDEARRLGTFELSTTAHDDCCTLFMPRSPETHAKLHEVDALWVQVPVSTWVAEILADMTHYRL